jgi:hypothetical protein
MAVREFNGTSDNIVHSTGGLSGMTYGTVAIIFKTSTTTGDRQYHCLITSGAGFAGNPAGQRDNKLVTFSGGYSTLASPTLTTDRWWLAVMRKDTGTVNPRWSVYDFTGDAWVHGNGDVARADWTAPGASGTIECQFGGAEHWSGRLAVRASWTNEVHWTADASGDTAIEAAGLETSLQNWVDETPDALWAYNQDPLSAVDDIVGGADQSSVSGTTVVTGDDPPGFSFSLGPAPSLWFTQAAVQPR